MKPSRQSTVRQAKYAGKHTVNMPVNLSAIDAMIADLEEDVSAAVRPAAQAGAQVIYEAVLKNVGAIRSVTGNLRNSIYQAFSKDNSREVQGGYAKATYHVSWNAKVAPHGHLIEYGHLQRYEYYKDGAGRVRPMPKPENAGKVPPWVAAGRKRPRAGEALQWYQPRDGGPVQVPARPFIRPAYYRQGEAIAAVRAKFFDVLGAK